MRRPDDSANPETIDCEQELSQAWAESDQKSKEWEAKDRRIERLSTFMGIGGLLLILFFPGSAYSVFAALHTLSLPSYIGAGLLVASVLLPRHYARMKMKSRICLFGSLIEKLSGKKEIVWNVGPRIGQLIFPPYDVVLSARMQNAPKEWVPLYEIVIPIPDLDALTRQCNFNQLEDKQIEIYVARNSYCQRHAFYP